MTDEQAADAGQDEAQELAAQAVDPCVTSAVAVAAFWTNGDEAIDFKPTYAAIQRQVQEVKRGKLAGVEAMLVGQSIALNDMFVDLARRAQANLGQRGNAAERYLRLALKAQNQCRATLDTLGVITRRPTKDKEDYVPITRIERVIIRPGDADYDDYRRKMSENELKDRA